eukprot:4517466-Pyramimonas_sp.AAC.1
MRGGPPDSRCQEHVVDVHVENATVRVKEDPRPGSYRLPVQCLQDALEQVLPECACFRMPVKSSEQKAYRSNEPGARPVPVVVPARRPPLPWDLDPRGNSSWPADRCLKVRLQGVANRHLELKQHGDRKSAAYRCEAHRAARNLLVQVDGVDARFCPHLAALEDRPELDRGVVALGVLLAHDAEDAAVQDFRNRW